MPLNAVFLLVCGAPSIDGGARGVGHEGILCEKAAPGRPASHDEGPGRGKRIVLIVDKSHLKSKLGEVENEVMGQNLAGDIGRFGGWDPTRATRGPLQPTFLRRRLRPGRAAVSAAALFVGWHWNHP